MSAGLVSFTEKGNVFAKVIVGCNGEHFLDLAKLVVSLDGRHPDPEAEEILKLEGFRPGWGILSRAAEIVGFGCEKCRIVLQAREPIENEDASFYPPNRNWETFTDPWAHPQQHGKVGCTAVVEIGDGLKTTPGWTRYITVVEDDRRLSIYEDGLCEDKDEDEEYEEILDW